MTLTRRSLLVSAVGVAAAGLAAGTAAADTAGIQAQQPDWHYCYHCAQMFFNGYPSKGSCPVRGYLGHQLHGWMFLPPYNFPADANHQNNWRYCEKCMAMFWYGRPDNGVCGAGGQHAAQGWEFTLPHDFSQLPIWSQDNWRFCNNCYVLYWAGNPYGKCAGGVYHNGANSFNFMMPYQP